MIAELFKHANGFERLAAFSAQQAFDVRAVDEVVVQVQLERRKIAEHNVFILPRQVFGEDVICASYDELVDQFRKLLESFITLEFVRVRSCRVTTSQDGQLKFLPEVHARTEIIGICKV